MLSGGRPISMDSKTLTYLVVVTGTSSDYTETEPRYYVVVLTPCSK